MEDHGKQILTHISEIKTKKYWVLLGEKYLWLQQRGLLCYSCHGLGKAKMCYTCLNTGIPPIPLRELGLWPKSET